MSHQRTGTTIGPLPLPPDQYDRRYLSQLVRSLEMVLKHLAGPDVGYFTGLTLSDLPVTGQGLEFGQVFSDGGFLRMVRQGEAFPGPLYATASLGTVTVSIS